MLVVCDKDYKVSGKLKIREEQDPYPTDEEVLIRYLGKRMTLGGLLGLTFGVGCVGASSATVGVLEKNCRLAC